MWFLISCVAVGIIVKVLIDWMPPEKFPPGPRGLPLIGNILDLKRIIKKTKYLGDAWCQLAKDYGSVVGLRLGFSDPLIIVSGREAVLEMLNREEFDGRPEGYMFRLRTLGQTRGVLFTDGEIWKDQRRFALKSLRDFGFGKRSMESMILEEGVTLSKIIENKAKEGIVNDVHKISAFAVLNSFWSLIAGARYDQNEQDSELVGIMQTINDAIRSNNAIGGIINQLPFLRFFIPGPLGLSEHKDRIVKIWKYFSKEVTRHKQTKIYGEQRDLIDAYLEEIKCQNGKPSSSFDENQLISLVKDLFSAGIETTNNTIGFTLMYLMINQNVQKKLHEELDRVLGNDTLPSLDYRNRLPYLNAILAEVARMANIGPTTIPHRAKRDSIFLGYKIKKNSMILANLLSVHMDKGHWGDPEVFRPERFINDNGQFINDSWLIPFGAGRRKCLGENLAKNTLLLFTACLFQKLHFRLPPGDPLPAIKGIDGFTISPAIFNAIVTPR
ncbi:methyl farnesoate epoxidase [Cephus cinctus]|uniref:Methyl farnesoate epoxidase n=1 Tax=Cephus cinctus TaxID=211228 RepID=A0AAJ7CCD3_CEPCN|nr:methyl farnesoate epoxidase [Cephus cinctus]